jgi:2-Cys peroxiredoxin 5
MLVKVGDAMPDVELMENSPGNKVSLANELKGKGLVIGVPAAFSPSCSEKHIPSYINFRGLKDAGPVFVVSVNDPFVMKAWAASLDKDSKSGVRGYQDRCDYRYAL